LELQINCSTWYNIFLFLLSSSKVTSLLFLLFIWWFPRRGQNPSIWLIRQISVKVKYSTSRHRTACHLPHLLEKCKQFATITATMLKHHLLSSIYLPPPT